MQRPQNVPSNLEEISKEIVIFFGKKNIGRKCVFFTSPKSQSMHWMPAL